MSKLWRGNIDSTLAIQKQAMNSVSVYVLFSYQFGLPKILIAFAWLKVYNLGKFHVVVEVIKNGMIVQSRHQQFLC